MGYLRKSLRTMDQYLLVLSLRVSWNYNGIINVRSSPYHLASNGLEKRAVQLFKHGGIALHHMQQLEDYLQNYCWADSLDLLHPKTEKRVLKSQTRQKTSHDMHCKARSFQIGESVYVKNFVGSPT